MAGREGWNAARLLYMSEEYLGVVLQPRLGDRTIETVEELEAVLRASAASETLFAKVWLREGLEDVARRYWEAGRGRRRPVRTG
jgi:hypothetical protein